MGVQDSTTGSRVLRTSIGWNLRCRTTATVETLEHRYADAFETKDTLEQKVQEGVKVMLAEFGARACAMSGSSSLVAAFDEGWRRVDEDMGLARDTLSTGVQKARQAKGQVEAAVDCALELVKERGILPYDEIPIPWPVNGYIIRAYRFHVSKLNCVRSVFGVHNEILNVWTHRIGFVIVLSLAFYFYPNHVHFSQSTKSDGSIAAIFFTAACKYLGCSVCFNSISEQSLMERFACVDYTGIALLVGAMTTVYCAFYCEPISRWSYLLTTAFFSIARPILPWNPTFNRVDMSWAPVGCCPALVSYP